ncbi:MAG: AprI/Inh family metalloprotease inhibitor [Variibacter sp.]|nr:AprI/Inh family metalloprotease inhibitor [Variibacter sp.]
MKERATAPLRAAGRPAGVALAVLGGLLASAATAPAQAPAPASEAAKGAVGTWEMSNAERDRTCIVTLKDAAAGVGAAIAWDPKCAEAFPFTRNVVAWTVGAREAIQLLDARGRPVLELSEVEGGLYEGERPGEGLVFLQSVAGGAAEQRKPEELAGEWAFTRESGRPLCRVTLTTTPAAQDALAVKVKPGCDAAVAGFGPVAWRFDRGQLVLIPARGEVWRFEEVDPTTWQRIPELREPLRLVRQ